MDTNAGLGDGLSIAHYPASRWSKLLTSS